jgi:hypothetical protein
MGIARVVVVVAGFMLLVACEKKDDAPRARGATGSTVKNRDGVGAVNAGLASAQGGVLDSAKSALVAQQCALACGVRPENDPGLCTQRCAKECLTATDLPGVDACAQRVANP